MAARLPNRALPASEVCFPATWLPNQRLVMAEFRCNTPLRTLKICTAALDRNSIGGDGGSSSKKAAAAPNLNYVVPLDKSSCITRPLAEILRDLNKRIPDNIIKTQDDHSTFIPWYQANRMLSFYAPGWCGEIRDVIFADNGSVTVVYRVTVRGLDGEIKLQFASHGFF